MKQEIRCPKDNTLLCHVEPMPGGQISFEPAGQGIAVNPKPSKTPGRTGMYPVCPKCGTETFAFFISA